MSPLLVLIAGIHCFRHSLSMSLVAIEGRYLLSLFAIIGRHSWSPLLVDKACHHNWSPSLVAIADHHCWSSLLVAITRATAGRHRRLPLRIVIAGRHCWLPSLGPPLVATASRHCGSSLLVAIVDCQCWDHRSSPPPKRRKLVRLEPRLYSYTHPDALLYLI